MKPQQWCECTHPWMMRMLQFNATMMCCHMCHCQSHDSLCEWSMSRRASDEEISDEVLDRLSRLRGLWLIMCRGIISFFTTPQLKKTAEWSTNHITWIDQAHVTTSSITGDRPVQKLVVTEVVSEPSVISPIKQHTTKPNPIISECMAPIHKHSDDEKAHSLRQVGSNDTLLTNKWLINYYACVSQNIAQTLDYLITQLYHWTITMWADCVAHSAINPFVRFINQWSLDLSACTWSCVHPLVISW